MSNKKNKMGKVTYIIILIILFIILYFAYEYYQENNFNNFIRSETNLYTSEFKRDKNEKYSEHRSYQITSAEYNDAMFYKEVKVEKNTPYRVTCMVKTSEVEAEKESSGIGAQISIEGTTERSVAIQGTNDWQKIELIFNSKNRESVNIGFRLGGYLGKAKGKVWFSDFTLEEGTIQNDNEWDFACFIFNQTDVNIDGKSIQIEMTNNDIKDINNTIKRFERSCEDLSDGKMKANCDVYQVNTPLSQLSYDETFGYYVSAENIESQIKETISNNNYDHIFVIVRLR